MVMGKKTGGKDFDKGNKFTPTRSEQWGSIIKARHYNREVLYTLISKYLAMDRNQLVDVANDVRTPAIDLMLIKIISKAIKTGDTQRANFLIEQMCGKLPTTVDVHGSSHADIVKLLEQKRKELEGDQADENADGKANN